jgi:uncharacterized delta-60 repeat protein
MSTTTSARRRISHCATCETLEVRRLLAAGDLDPTFSGDGKVSLDFPGGALISKDVAIQPLDGKSVVVGMRGDNAAVARFNVDGSLDTSFGVGGVYEWPQNDLIRANAVAIQADGKIVVAGKVFFYINPVDYVDRFAVARLGSNGLPDTAFGGFGTGVAQTDVEDNDEAYDVVVQRDGKIVAAGSALIGVIFDDTDFVIARFNENGSLDGGFGDGGVAELDFGYSEGASAVAIDYSGNFSTNPRYGFIVAAGSLGFDDGLSRFAVARLGTNGGLDHSFDGNGMLTTSFPGSGDHAGASGVTVQSSGNIVVCGQAYGSDLSDFAMARYLVNGALDTSFGGNGTGTVRTDFGGTNDVATSVTTSYIGGLVVAGVRNQYAPTLDSQLAIAAYTVDGRIDTRFSDDGMTTVNFDGDLAYAGVATTGNLIQPIRRLVVAGGAGMARYVDVGSRVSIGSFDPYGAEAGQEAAHFIVTRTERLPTPERVYLAISGTAAPPQDLAGRPRDYNGTGISFVNTLLGSSYVEFPANENIVAVTITPVDDALVEGDETAIFSIIPRESYDIHTNPSTTLSIRDNDVLGGPTVNAAQFAYQTAPQRVLFTFNQDVGGSIADADFQLTGPAGMPAHTFGYDSVTNTATLSFSGILPDGHYTARAIAAGITNGAGTPMPADHVLNFFFLQGDANHDGRVNLLDFNILAANFGQSNRDFTQGDFNYNGTVNLQDFNILAGRFGASVAPVAEFGNDDDVNEIRRDLTLPSAVA